MEIKLAGFLVVGPRRERRWRPYRSVPDSIFRLKYFNLIIQSDNNRKKFQRRSTMSNHHDKISRKGDSRRRLIKALASGGAVVATTSLPNRWSKPVVDSVVLPAHAQTTVGADFFGTQTTALIVSSSGGAKAFARVADAIAGPAHAGSPAIAEQRIFECSAKITGPDTCDFVLKMTEIMGCPSNPSQTNEYSSFHTGSCTNGVGQSIPGTWCDGGTAPANLTILFHPDFLEAFGDVDSASFNISLVSGSTVVFSTPCVDCPPLS